MKKCCLFHGCFAAVVIACALLFTASLAGASIPDAIDATCRLTSGDGSIGTGVVFEVSNGRVYVITNAHVATSIRMELEFWSNGHLSKKIVGSTVLRVNSKDVAVVACDASIFGRFLPKPMPLAPRDYKLHIGQKVTSVGCAAGSWATAFVGHVNEYEVNGGTIEGGYSLQGNLKFLPPPAGGRSGSALFDGDATMIVALIHVRVEDPNGPWYGLAVSIQDVYAAVYGNTIASTGVLIPKDRAVFWPPQVQSQCGPGGCPLPPRALPYRRENDRRDQQQDRRLEQQDKRIDDLYPTQPFVLPPPITGPDPYPELPPEPEFTRPASKPELPWIFTFGGVLVALAVGGIIGLIVQWKATYPKE